MIRVCKILILFGLMGGAFVTVFLKFNFLSKGDIFFKVICYGWILYNFYACFFNRPLLAPSSIDTLPLQEQKYVRYVFVVLINGGLYVGLFFT